MNRFSNGYDVRGLSVPERVALRSEVQPDGCWRWLAPLCQGYGKFRFGGRTYLAHRASYEAHVGPIPDGLELDHLCLNTWCVNPDHLEPVTQLENMRRRYALQTECAYGHEYTEENTRTRNGRRTCRVCDRRRQRECKARRAVA